MTTMCPTPIPLDTKVYVKNVFGLNIPTIQGTIIRVHKVPAILIEDTLRYDILIIDSKFIDPVMLNIPKYRITCIDPKDIYAKT